MSVIMDFTTTAMARPSILNTTLNSFSKNLVGIDLKKCRLIINIDPLPPEIRRKNVVKVARKYFGEVIYNYPKTANFTAAVNWTWSRAKTEYIFHLEDDWELTQKVSIPKVIKHFEINKQLLQIIFRAYRYRYITCALSPSIIHRRMYSAIGGNLNEKMNPEAQLRGERFGIIMPRRGKPGITPAGKIVVHPPKSRKIVLRDLGRAWIRKTKYKKTGAGKKARFLTWESKR